MPHNILLTGASGYLGGSILANWSSANLPKHGNLYALTRNAKAAEAVRSYGAEPAEVDVKDLSAVRELVWIHKITIVLYLIDAVNPDGQLCFVDALSAVGKATGQDVHLIHTSGAKVFSSHAGAPTDGRLSDTAPDLFDIQKAQVSKLPMLQKAIVTNNTVIEAGETHGVSTYILIPPIVYGKGSGFGNPISIQTTAIVQAAQAVRRVLSVDSGRAEWPVCHIDDNTTLYLQLIRRILDGSRPAHGQNGYYLAASGSVSWTDVYAAIAKVLAEKGRVDDGQVRQASDEELSTMGKARGCPSEYVSLQLGGTCSFTAAHGETLGWKPKYSPKHIIDTADEETERILAHLDENPQGYGSQITGKGS